MNIDGDGDQYLGRPSRIDRDLGESARAKARQKDHAGLQNNTEMNDGELTFDELSLVRLLVFIFLFGAEICKTSSFN